MDEKKPSTSDILAKIRAQKAAAAGGAAPSTAAPTPAPEAPAPVEAAAAAPVETPAAPKPAAPAAKPGSTKDIMAAIRAKGAGGAAAAAPAPAAAAAPAEPTAAKPVVAAAAAGPRPSVQDMLKAVREGKVGAAAAAPAAVAGAKPVVSAPPAPVKPLPASAKKAAPAPARRGLAGIVTVTLISAVCLVTGSLTGSVTLLLIGTLIWMVLVSPFMSAWASLTGVGGIWTLATARFMFPNVLVEPPSKFKVGPASDYPINTVSNKWKDQFGIWVVHTDQYEGQNLIFALASVCTHLGCTPSWLDGEQKFKCPCHGSGFYITGVNFEGPAPRPLERVGLRVAEGMLEVDKSVKFQEEMGQWNDPASFVAAS